MGSWFPSASLIKGLNYDEGQEISLLLFYHYVEPKWTEPQKAKAIAFTEGQGSTLMLGGRCRVACEGMNCTISGTAESVRKFAKELAEFDQDFKKTDFKYVDGLGTDRAFKDLKVLPLKELVFYGMDNQHTLGKGGLISTRGLPQKTRRGIDCRDRREEWLRVRCRQIRRVEARWASF